MNDADKQEAISESSAADEGEKLSRSERLYRYQNAAYSAGDANDITIEHLVAIYEHQMEDQLAFPELHVDQDPDTHYFHESMDLKDLKVMKDDLRA